MDVIYNILHDTMSGVTFDPKTEQFNLLIIDPQNDFMMLPYNDVSADAGKRDVGKLPVVGSDGDVTRISKFIRTHKDRIKQVFVSLDTHTLGHIGHKLLTNINPKTGAFSMESTLNGDFNENQQTIFKKYLSIYLARLGGHAPQTWPVHCFEGSEGWKVNPTILEELKQLDKDKVTYHIKGQNQLAEMYSIMKAEVPVEDILEEMKETGSSEDDIKFIKSLMYTPYVQTKDSEIPNFKVESNPKLADLEPANFNQYTPVNSMEEINYANTNLQTTLNKKLFKDLTRHMDGDKTIIGEVPIVVCGEARSHCVRASTRDIVEEIRRKGLKNKVVLIENCASKVILPHPVDPDMFTPQDTEFINDMINGTLTFPPYNTTSIKDDGSKSVVNTKFNRLIKNPLTYATGRVASAVKYITPTFMKNIGGRVSRKRRPKKEGKRRSYRI